MHPLLKNIGHRFFPFLVRPYRRIRYKLSGLKYLSRELGEVGELRRKSFGDGSEISRFYNQFYHDGCRNQRLAEGIVCMADGRMLHGGLTDRMRGILTTYRYAKKHSLPFYIHWTCPFRLEDYLVPSGPVDWRIEADRISCSRQDSFPVVIMETEAPQTHLVNWLKLKAAMHRPLPQTHVYSNADNARGGYRRLYEELFAPSPRLRQEVDRHLEAIGGKYWSFTFRCLNLLGDFVEHDNTTLDPEGQEALLERIWSEFQRIAADVPAGYRILITSDSRKLLDYMEEKDERIYIVPGDVKNIDLAKGEFKDAWLKTFTDQQLIMLAEKVYLMRTGRMYRSGFPRFAAEIGGRPFVYHQF